MSQKFAVFSELFALSVLSVLSVLVVFPVLSLLYVISVLSVLSVPHFHPHPHIKFNTNLIDNDKIMQPLWRGRNAFK